MKHLTTFLFPFAASFGSLVLMPEIVWWRGLIAAACAGIGGFAARSMNGMLDRRNEL